MSPEEAIQVADEVLLAHAGNPLMDIQRMILRESLAGKGYESMEGYVPQHIKNEGKKLWDLLSEALGEKVSKTSFKGALEKRWKLGKLIPKAPMLSIYNPQTWVGRKAIVDECLPKLQGQVRVLWVTGISGIGKTALGECLASQAWDDDPSFQWLYFDILEGQSREFVSVAADLLAKLGDIDFDPQERNDPKRLMERLLRKLKVSRYWIQVDSLERLLNSEQPTEFLDAYWVTFLQRCLTESNMVSRLVLTAQALPIALVEFGDRYPNVWAEIRLDGLLQVEQQLEFFAKRGLAVAPANVVESSNRGILTRIAQIYEGHPLVLKVIAEDILKEFAGDVDRYWQVYQPEFEQVARELQATCLDETEYNEALDRKVRERIKRSLEQLPADALDLLCRSAVFRRPVPKKFWLAMIGDRTPQQQKAAYGVLGDRALIEKEGPDIRQHNLIRSVVYDLLKADTPIWEAAERQAAHHWLSVYAPPASAPNLETVRGYLEAFDHYCNVEDWNAAKELLTQIIDTPAQSNLCWQLDVWGYYREEIRLCEKLLGRCDSDVDLRCLNALCHGYIDLGDYSKTIEAAEYCLKIAREIGNRQAEGAALSNLGVAYYCLGNSKQSIDFLRQYLTIAQEIGNRRDEGKALGNLGLMHRRLGQYEQALDYFQKRLVIACEMGDRRGEGNALGNLGSTYSILGQYERAIDYHHQALLVWREIEDRGGEGCDLGNLGNAYSQLEHYEQAIDFHQQALVISQELGDRRSEGQDLGNLGIAHFKIGHYEQAVGFYQQQLTITQEIGDRQGEGSALVKIGETQLKQEQYSGSLTSNQAALKIFREIGFREGEVEALKNLAELNQAMGEVEVAQDYCQQALALATELGLPLAKECRKLQGELEEHIRRERDESTE